VPLVVAAIALAGCTPEAPEPTSSATPSPTRTTATPTPTPTPTFDPEGSAEDNLPVFSDVVEEVWASGDRGLGRSYIDGLVAVGFDKAAMQVTQDLSTVGNPAESIEFSVLFDEKCIVGQVGTTIPEPVSVVMPVLPGGLCLVGATRPIDW
jgi:hypothetical protein